MKICLSLHYNHKNSYSVCRLTKKIVNFNEKQNILRYASIAGSVNAYFSDDDGKAVALDVHVYKFSASDRPF